MGVFVSPRRLARPRSGNRVLRDLNTQRQFFGDWFEDAEALITHAQHWAVVHNDRPLRGVESNSLASPSINDVVIPHGRIHDNWLSDLEPSIKGYDSDVKENNTPITKAARRHRKLS